MKKICRNCKSWVNGNCMQTEFKVYTNEEMECFIVGFIQKEEIDWKNKPYISGFEPEA